MLMNHIKIFIRNIQKHKVFSLINVSGLTIAMAASFMIFLFVSHELSYDRFHRNSDRLYRVRNDRIYARDAISGKFLVLSRQWGSPCRKPAALNYGFGGGCWYPVRETYPGWRSRPHGWLRLRP